MTPARRAELLDEIRALMLESEYAMILIDNDEFDLKELQELQVRSDKITSRIAEITKEYEESQNE